MDELNEIAPINFFQIGADIHSLPSSPKKRSAKEGHRYLIDAQNFSHYQLPDTSAFCREHPFAKVAMGWCSEGLEFAVHADVSTIRCSYPNISSGDSIELMIDTRDVKTSGYNTRFCHHFFFLPEAIDGIQCGEITRFRTEDTHELCDPKTLELKMHKHASGYTLHLFIPGTSLHGYDPEQFKRLGLTYRINRAEGSSQHFSVLSEEFQIEQQPSLWGSATLVYTERESKFGRQGE